MTFTQSVAHPAATTASASLTIGVGNLHTDCGKPPAHASFVRVIVSWSHAVSDAHPCAIQAHDAGLRVLLVVQWNNSLTSARIVRRFRIALAQYQDVRPFAVAVGNEQEGPWNGGAAEYAYQYAAVWRTVEPLIASAFPHAIRVAGETSPWGDSFMAAAANVGLPGAQAYAYHAYPAVGTNGQGAAQEFAALAQAHHVQAWADEGLCRPGAWTLYGCSTASQLKREGFSLAAEWHVTSQRASVPVIGGQA